MAFSGFLQIAHGEITSTGDSTPQVNPGSLAMVNGYLYRYVEFDNGTAVAAAAGGLAYWKTPATFVVSSDYSDAGSDISNVAGIFQSVLTDAYFGWILVSGYYATITTNGDDDISQGDWLIGSSTDLACNSVAAGVAPTYRPFGLAMADDVDGDNTVAGWVNTL